MKLKAFSYNELLLVAAIASILALMTAPFYLNYIRDTNVNFTHSTLLRLLRSAQNNSMLAKDSTSWGVCVIDDEMVLYKSSCIASNAVDTILIPSNVTLAGLTDIEFIRYSGEINQASIQIDISAGSFTRRIIINRIGGYDEI